MHHAFSIKKITSQILQKLITNEARNNRDHRAHAVFKSHKQVVRRIVLLGLIILGMDENLLFPPFIGFPNHYSQFTLASPTPSPLGQF